MSQDEPKTECDPANIVCQLQVLRHLRGIKHVLTQERFQSSYPELVGLDTKIAERIKESGIDINEALKKCNFPQLEELDPDLEELNRETIIEEPPPSIQEEEE